MISIQYRDFFNNKEHIIFNILIFLFFYLYIFKQSTLSYLFPVHIYNILFNLSFFSITSIFIFLKRNSLIKNLKFLRLKNTFLLISSIIISQMLFFDNDRILTNLSKLLIISIIVLSISDNFKNYINLISDSIFTSVLSVFFISNFFLPINKFDIQIWTKASIGFVNPNVPSIFIFTCICGYFLIHSKTKFILSSSIYFLMYFIFETHSRTATFSILFLVIGFFINSKFIKYSFRNLSIFTNSIFLTLLFFSNSLEFKICCNGGNYISKLDALFSKRLIQLFEFNWIKFNTEGPILKVFLIDSLLLEMIFYIGFISIFIYFMYYLNILKLRNEFYKPEIAINIILIAGLFEGLFFKISPITIFLSTVFFDNFLTKSRKFNLNKNQNQIK